MTSSQGSSRGAYRTAAPPAPPKRQPWLRRAMCVLGFHCLKVTIHATTPHGDHFDSCRVTYPCCGKVIKEPEESPRVLGDQLSIRQCFTVIERVQELAWLASDPGASS